MIIPHDAPKSAASFEQKATVTDISPPAYEPRSGAPPHIKPANFIAISRPMGEVKGTFVLDPTLSVRTMRGDDQAHLSISALMGEVTVEVYVVGSEALQNGKTRIVVASTMGTTKLQLHAPAPRAPMSVNVSARLGEVTLLLPRSFRGPLRTSVALGAIELSAALRAVTTTFGDGRMFVGAWTQDELEEKVWSGDEAIVNSQLGSVYVRYDDEDLKT